MRETLIGIGRGIDGVVGRMVDRVGDPAGDRGAPRDEVVLVRYVVLVVAAGRESVLHVDETLVTDGATGRRLEERLLAPFADRADRGQLRVHARVLRRWPRRTAPRTAIVEKPTATAPPPGGRASDRPPAARPSPGAGRVSRPPKPPAPPDAPQDPLTSRVLDALAAAGPGGLSMAELVEATGERSARLRARLTKLILAGTVRRAGDGLKTRYRRTDR